MLTNNHEVVDHQVPLTIFDLDGTLADVNHRRYLVEAPWIEVPRNYRLTPNQKHEIREGAMFIRDPQFKPNWNAFYTRCDQDAPVWPVIGTMMALYQYGEDVRIWSGRDSSVRGKTLMWLHVFTKIPLIKLDLMLKMRPEGDFTPDVQLKHQWLEELSARERLRLRAVYDDRDAVVKMWRDSGVACFQVAPGDF